MNRLPARSDPIWHKWARTDPILAGTLKHDEPLTRDVWLRRAYVLSDEVPDPVPDDQMPPPFRHGVD
jgi:hypothetical protein